MDLLSHEDDSGHYQESSYHEDVVGEHGKEFRFEILVELIEIWLFESKTVPVFEKVEVGTNIKECKDEANGDGKDEWHSTTQGMESVHDKLSHDEQEHEDVGFHYESNVHIEEEEPVAVIYYH